MTILVVTGQKEKTLAQNTWGNLFMALVAMHPEHRFVTVPAKNQELELPLLPNLALSASIPSGSIPVLKHLRRNLVLSRLARQYQASLLLSLDVLMPPPPVTSIFLLGDETVQQITSARITASRTEGSRSGWLQAAKAVIVCSQQAVTRLQQVGKPTATLPVQQIALPAAGVFKPLDWTEKQAVKDGFTGGREYFLYHGPITASPAIISLLKAFSLFKKRQMSNMKLVLAGPQAENSLAQKLATYKYRADVAVLAMPDAATLAALTAAAYALVDPFETAGFSVNRLQSLFCGTPVLSCAFGEPVTDGVVNCHADAEALAEKMKLLYKDENLRNLMSEKALATSKNYDTALLAKKLSLAAGLSVTEE